MGSLVERVHIFIPFVSSREFLVCSNGLLPKKNLMTGLAKPQFLQTSVFLPFCGPRWKFSQTSGFASVGREAVLRRRLGTRAHSGFRKHGVFGLS